MNPFWLLPQKVSTVEEAERIIARYQAEQAASVARKQSIEEILVATADVLGKAHPNLAQDFDLLIESAKAVGHEEGERECLDTMLTDFRRALPIKIKQAMGLTVKV